jgi:hypothetical protein
MKEIGPRRYYTKNLIKMDSYTYVKKETNLLSAGC